MYKRQPPFRLYIWQLEFKFISEKKSRLSFFLSRSSWETQLIYYLYLNLPFNFKIKICINIHNQALRALRTNLLFQFEHIIFVHIVKQKLNKVRRFYKKNYVDFKNLLEIKFCWRQIFKILIFHKPSLGSCDVSHKIWTWSVQPFWCLLDTNKQTDRQTSKIYIDNK